MPITELTIAFIGKPNVLVSEIAKHVAAYNYRLLFCGDGPEDFRTLQKWIRQQHPSISIKDMDDSYCSCWEADVVFLSGDSETEKEFLNKVQPVVANKVIVSIEEFSTNKNMSIDLENRVQKLQQFLPYSRVIAVTSPFLNEKDNHEKNVLIAGNDDKALTKVSELLEVAGFIPGNS